MKLLDMLGGNLLDGAANIIGKFVQDPSEAAAMNLELKRLIHAELSEKEQTIRTTMQARERVMVAELSQSDTYTKRARPTTVYFGLAVIAFNYCLVPLISMLSGDLKIVTFELPTEFWMAWGGVVATWSIGRSAEKFGIQNKATALVTGTPPKKKPPPIDDFWDEEGD